MQSCFSILIVIVAALGVIVSLVRWFEQTSDAVDARQWNRLAFLIAAPFAVWMYPSRISAGRPMMPPRHEPIRGFGSLPKGGIQEQDLPDSDIEPARHFTPSAPNDLPPPGTPKEFLGLPKIPPKKAPRAVDPEKLAKLKQKMKEQGMLPEE